MYAVITGASGGFGREFAVQLAKRGYDLCICARNSTKLQSLKNELEKSYSIHTDIFTADLSKEEDANALYEFTKKHKVDVLINNAGLACGGNPSDSNLSEEMDMLSVNVRSVHFLTRKYLTDMIADNSGKILNVSSLSAWLPTPFLSAYAAGKAYVLHFSEGLNYELKKIKSSVRVSVVTPGFFNTGIADGKGNIQAKKRSLEKYTAQVVEKFLKGKEIINLGKDRQIAILQYFTHRTIAKHIMFRSLMKGIQ